LAIFGTGIGYWIRRSLPESLEYIFEHVDEVTQKKSDILRLAIQLIKSYPLRCFAIVSIAWLGVAETAAIFVYSPIHMTTINHFSPHQAMGMNTISLFFLIPLYPFSDIFLTTLVRSNC
jgi:MHS family proline/betaine transporter-like MFS transporter